MARVKCRQCEGTGRSGIGKSYEVNCSWCHGSGWVDEADSSSSTSAAERAENEARSKANWEALYSDFNKMIRAFNAKNWDEVIKQEWVADSNSTYNFYGKVLPSQDSDKAHLMAGIAHANRDDDYEAAFEAGWTITYADDSEILCPAAIEAGKKAWERKNGRAISQDELNKIRLKYIEKIIAFRAKNSKGEGLTSKDAIIKEWVSLSGMRLTLKHQIRIYGKPFLNIGRIICVSMVIVAVSVFLIVNFTRNMQYEKELGIQTTGLYKYYLNETGDGVILDSYTGKAASEVIIPDEIDGFPVVGINYIFDSGSISSYGITDALTSVQIPDTVTNIINFLYDCKNVTQITLPGNLKIIGNSAFQNSGLTSVIIPEGVTSIGDYAFSGCSNLTTVVLPKSLERIGIAAFGSCYSLADVQIPAGANITYRKEGNIEVFNNCVSLSDASKQAIINSGFTGKLSETIALSEALVTGQTAKIVFDTTMTDAAGITGKSIRAINKDEIVILTGKKSKSYGDEYHEVFYEGYTGWVINKAIVIQSNNKFINWVKETWAGFWQ